MNSKYELMTEALLSEIGNELITEPKWLKYTSLAEDLFLYFSRSNGKEQGEKLKSIFNRMNGNKQEQTYSYNAIDAETPVVFPDDKASSEQFDKAKLLGRITSLVSVCDRQSVNSILECFEKYTSYLPASYSQKCGNDISYYDKVKMICAVSSCLYDYYKANDAEDLSFDKIKCEDVFLLYSFDTSGIQKFIYTITSNGAQKGLRARSFYLEILMETIVVELLERLELSKASLLYAGGGHAYLLLSNTEKTKAIVKDFIFELKQWIVRNFRGELYIADGYCPCSADSLANEPEGSYRSVFRSVSAMISDKKSQRYDSEDFKLLNKPLIQHERECVICHNSDKLDINNKCSMCSMLEKLAPKLQTAKYFFVFSTSSKCADTLPLPFNKRLKAIDSDITEASENDIVFSKNTLADKFTGAYFLPVGDYVSDPVFSNLAEASVGIERLGILRADVDNLGRAFVAGFPEKINTLSRTSSFSRQMSRFFKGYINNILKNGKFKLDNSAAPSKRNALIVYSGGDDVFIVGSWNDIIGIAVDMYNEFKRFSQGTLSISAGIGIYPDKYPIIAMARESGELEDHSKELDGKDAVTLFDKSNRYHWDEFIDKVVGEKLKTLSDFFENNQEKGNALMYQMLELIRLVDSGDRLNLARFAYLLARLRPEKKNGKTNEKETREYELFSDKMYSWIQDASDRHQLITAIQIYVYLHRESKKEEK